MDIQRLIDQVHNEDTTHPLIPLLDQWQRLSKSPKRDLGKINSQVAKITTALGNPLLAPLPHDLREEVDQALLEQRQELDRERSAYQLALGQNLETSLHEYGVLPQGNFDRLLVGLLLLKLNFQTFTFDLWYGDEQEIVFRNKSLPSDPMVLIDLIANQPNHMGSAVEAQRFAAMCVMAYRIAALESPDAHVRITHLLPWVALQMQSEKFRLDPVRGKFRDYTRRDFSYDLYRCQEEVQSVLHLTPAVKSDANSKRTYLWIPSRNSVDGGKPYSRVSLVGEGVQAQRPQASLIKQVE